MSSPAGASYGLVKWTLVDFSTGRVGSGEKELLSTDFEVVVIPAPPRPRLDLRHSGPRRTAADAVGWLIRGGRGSTTKRFRLAHGFWLVLRERRTPSRSRLVLLTARRDAQRLSTADWFRVDEDGATASREDEAGSLRLEWAQDAEGFQELVSTTVTTDIDLDLRAARGPSGRTPLWQLRILAGSTIRWPPAADGVQLVPRLRPDRSGPS